MNRRAYTPKRERVLLDVVPLIETNEHTSHSFCQLHEFRELECSANNPTLFWPSTAIVDRSHDHVDHVFRCCEGQGKINIGQHESASMFQIPWGTEQLDMFSAGMGKP